MTIRLDLSGSAVTSDEHPTSIARALQQRFRYAPPLGYVRGKTALRDALVALRNDSTLQAERWVDRLEALGLIRFEAIAGRPARWVFSRPRSRVGQPRIA